MLNFIKLFDRKIIVEPVAIGICLTFFIISFLLPLIIADFRDVSKANRSSILILTILGLFFLGIPWLVALILACVYKSDSKS
jgi:hypothetical protein